MISLVFMVAQIYLAPYCTPSLNITQSSSLLANTLALFVGLMLIIDYNMEAEALRAGDTFDTVGRSVISVIIVIVNLAVLVIPLGVFAVELNASPKGLSWSGKETNESCREDTESNKDDPESEVDVLISTDDSTINQQNQVPLPAVRSDFQFRHVSLPASSSVINTEIEGSTDLVFPTLPQVTVLFKKGLA
jgi:hypothetical protein